MSKRKGERSTRKTERKKKRERVMLADDDDDEEQIAISRPPYTQDPMLGLMGPDSDGEPDSPQTSDMSATAEKESGSIEPPANALPRQEIIDNSDQEVLGHKPIKPSDQNSVSETDVVPGNTETLSTQTESGDISSTTESKESHTSNEHTPPVADSTTSIENKSSQPKISTIVDKAIGDNLGLMLDTTIPYWRQYATFSRNEKGEIHVGLSPEIKIKFFKGFPYLTDTRRKGPFQIETPIGSVLNANMGPNQHGGYGTWKLPRDSKVISAYHLEDHELTRALQLVTVTENARPTSVTTTDGKRDQEMVFYTAWLQDILLKLIRLYLTQYPEKLGKWLTLQRTKWEGYVGNTMNTKPKSEREAAFLEHAVSECLMSAYFCVKQPTGEFESNFINYKLALFQDYNKISSKPPALSSFAEMDLIRRFPMLQECYHKKFVFQEIKMIDLKTGKRIDGLKGVSLTSGDEISIVSQIKLGFSIDSSGFPKFRLQGRPNQILIFKKVTNLSNTDVDRRPMPNASGYSSTKSHAVKNSSNVQHTFGNLDENIPLITNGPENIE